MDDLHRPAAEHVGRADHDRIADPRARSPRPPPARWRCRSAAGAARAGAAAAGSACRSSARSIASGEVPRIGISARSSAFARLSGVWPPNCTMTPSSVPLRLLDPHDLDHVLGGQRLEIEPVGGVVIGRDGLRVAVDHDRLDAGLAQAVGGMDAAVVELDPLADAVRAAAEDHDLVAAARIGLAFRRVDTRRPRSRNTCTGSATGTRRRRCRCACRPGARRAGAGRRGYRPPRSRRAGRAVHPKTPSASAAAARSRRPAARRGAPAPRPRRSRGCARGTTYRNGRRRGSRRS